MSYVENSCHAVGKSVFFFLMASFRIFLANMQYISLLALKPCSWKFVILVLFMLHEAFSMIISANDANLNFLSFLVKNEVIFWLSFVVLAWT
jgi:hypothetical protein